MITTPNTNADRRRAHAQERADCRCPQSLRYSGHVADWSHVFACRGHRRRILARRASEGAASQLSRPSLAHRASDGLQSATRSLISYNRQSHPWSVSFFGDSFKKDWAQFKQPELAGKIGSHRPLRVHERIGLAAAPGSLAPAVVAISAFRYGHAPRERELVPSPAGQPASGQE